MKISEIILQQNENTIQKPWSAKPHKKINFVTCGERILPGIAEWARMEIPMPYWNFHPPGLKLSRCMSWSGTTRGLMRREIL